MYPSTDAMSDSESSAPSKGSSEDQHDPDFLPPQAKRSRVNQSSASGKFKRNSPTVTSLRNCYLGNYKYAVRGCDDKIQKFIGIAHPHKNLVTAAYADATWKKMFSAFNTFKNSAVKKITILHFP
jgi:hypothetical protein